MQIKPKCYDMSELQFDSKEAQFESMRLAGIIPAPSIHTAYCIQCELFTTELCKDVRTAFDMAQRYNDLSVEAVKHHADPDTIRHYRERYHRWMEMATSL